MKIKTSELIGAALDWAVAKCEGRRVEHDYQYTDETKFDGWWQLGPNHWQPLNRYATDWEKGGPIIEREHMEIYDHPEYGWTATIRPFRERGDTVLIAAMRCYVASKLGDTVDVPEDLV